MYTSSTTPATSTTSMNLVKTEDKNKLVMISLGNHIKVTRAAFYTLIAGVIFAVTIAFTAPVWGPVIAIITLLPWILIAYNVNCVQIGHCYYWGWILATVYLLTSCIALLPVLLKLFKFNKLSNKVENLKNTFTPKKTLKSLKK
jgi:hypothetical protein